MATKLNQAAPKRSKTTLGSDPVPRMKVQHQCAACGAMFPRRRDCRNHMDSCAEIKRQIAAKFETAKRWSVLFDTKDGKTHLKWYTGGAGQQITREQVERAAREALREEADWLVGIQDIAPSEYQSTEAYGAQLCATLDFINTQAETVSKKKG